MIRKNSVNHVSFYKHATIVSFTTIDKKYVSNMYLDIFKKLGEDGVHFADIWANSIISIMIIYNIIMIIFEFNKYFQMYKVLNFGNSQNLEVLFS